MPGYKLLRRISAIVALGVLAISAGGPARAATCTWDPNGNLTDSGGTWTTGAGNWYNGLADTGWADGGNVAAFGWGSGGTAPCTVTLGSNITAGGLVFNNPNYTIAPDAGNIYGVTLDAGGITANASAAVNVPLALSASQTWTAASGQTLTVGGNIVAGGNVLAVSGAGNATISAPLTTAADLNMVGSGTLDFCGAGNAIGGNLNAAGGTLELIGNSTTTAGNVYVANGGTSSGVAGGGNGTLNIKDNAVLNSNGSFFLGNQNGYSGTVNQSGGTVNLTLAATNTNFRIGLWPGETSSYNLSGGMLNVPGAITYVGWDGNGQLNLSGGTAALYGLQVAGGGNSWIHPGSGTLNLTGGLLQLGAGGLGCMSGQDTENLGGGTLAATANISTSASLNFTGNNGNTTIDTGTNTVTLSGNLFGSGGFNKIGGGTLALTQINTYSGGTVVSGGTLLVNPNSIDIGPGLLGSGTLTINAGATVDTYVNAFGFTPSGLIPIVINGGVLNQLAAAPGFGSDSHIGAVTMTGGTMSGAEFQPHGGITTNATNTTAVISAGTLNLQATLPFTVAAGGASPDLIVSSVISSVCGITKNGPGVMLVSGANTYAGPTTVNAGVLMAGGSNVLSPNSDLTISGGTLDATGFVQTVKSIAVGSSGSLDLAIGNLLTSTNAASLNGTLNLFGSSGGTQELIGYLSCSGSFSTATGIPSGYSLKYNPTQLDLVPGGPAAWAAATSGSWTDATKWSTNPAVPSGAGQGAVLNAATTSSLTVTLDSPQTVGTLLLGNSASSTTGYTLSAGVSGTLTLDNSGSTAQITVSDGTHAISAPLILAGDLAITPSGGATLAISGNVSQTGGARALTLNGPGTLMLSGSDGFSGGTTVDAGALILTSNTALLDGTNLTVGAGGTLDFDPSAGAAPSASVVTAVPEPGTFVLLAVGTIAAGFCIWRVGKGKSYTGPCLLPS